MTENNEGEFNFEVLKTPYQAVAFLAKWVLAFFDTLWLDTHGHLLRRLPEGVLLQLFDSKQAEILNTLSSMALKQGLSFPLCCYYTGFPMKNAASVEQIAIRRREILCLGALDGRFGCHTDPFEFDICKSK